MPGRSPHPRLDPRGHAHGAPEPIREALDPTAWTASETYLRGVDLFNFAYWWESHEAFEALWHGAGKHGVEADFFQALIQLAAAELKWWIAKDERARALTERARERLARLPSPFFGIDVEELYREAGARASGARRAPLLLRLDVPPCRDELTTEHAVDG
ncbi:Hypothetical protein A7982_02462 [Minicystis rosea]|nr:Hypothetical protein A7982_02462 [Minicystis rosea]